MAGRASTQLPPSANGRTGRRRRTNASGFRTCRLTWRAARIIRWVRAPSISAIRSTASMEQTSRGSLAAAYHRAASACPTTTSSTCTIAPRSARPSSWSSDAHLPPDRLLQKQGGFERGTVAAKAADELHAERQTVLAQAGNVDARRAHQRPYPVEHRVAGRGVSVRRGAGRRGREDHV